VQLKKVKVGKWLIVRCLGYLHAEADTIRGMEKCAVLHFGGIQRLACCAIAASAKLFLIIANLILSRVLLSPLLLLL